MAFATKQSEDILLSSGSVSSHPMNYVMYVSPATSATTTAGLALTIDSNGELVAYDGVKFDGVGKRSLNDPIDGDGNTNQLLRVGLISVDVLTGQTPVVGDTVGVDASGKFIVGGTVGTFIQEEQTDVWTILVGA